MGHTETLNKSGNGAGENLPAATSGISAVDGTNPTGIIYQDEIITPDRARDLLDTLPSMPKVDSSAVKYYASIMEADAWIENGQAIILDEEGRLLDGVHRLKACIEADKPFRTQVAYGASRDTMHTIDQHRRRNYAGVLESRGVKNASYVQRTLNRLIRIENGLFRKSDIRPSWARLDLVMKGNPEIVEACELAQDHYDGSITIEALNTFIFMALKSGHREAMERFLMELRDTSSSPNGPPWMLTIALKTLEMQSRKRQADIDPALALTILAFNDYLEGVEHPTPYSWHPDYGKDTEVDAAGKPLNMREVMEKAPRNVGLPEMTGYPGLTNGKIEEGDKELSIFRGEIAEMLKKAPRSEKGVSVISITVTPALAQEWLDQFNTGNRTIQKNHITNMSRDIKGGNWMVNAQPIAFHGNPLDPEAGPVRLLNGQHRLLACVEADTPIEVPIAINIAEEAFATFDVHTKRNKVQSNVDPRVLHSAAILQWREDNNHKLSARHRPTLSEIIATTQRHPGLAEQVRWIRKSQDHASLEDLGKPAVLSYFAYRIKSENEPLAERFLIELRDGQGLERGNPLIQIREELAVNRRQKGRAKKGRYAMLDYLLNSWESYKKWIGSQGQASGKRKGNAAMEDAEGHESGSVDPDQPGLFSS